MRRRLAEMYRDFKHLALKIPRIEVRASDCFLVSFPRSGNTWMRYMLFGALHPDRQWDLPQIEDQMPIIDRPDLKNLLGAMEQMPARMFKSHEQVSPHCLKGKVAYIIRDGRDALLSYHKYRQQMNKLKIPFHDFLRRSLEGRYRYGSWADHVRGWLGHEADPHMLMIRYEQMVADPAAELSRTLAHFGFDVDRPLIEAAAKRSSVERVNAGFAKVAAQQQRNFSGGSGGGSGKWRSAYSPADLALFQRHGGDMLKQMGYDE